MIGAAALAAGLLFIRHQKQDAPRPKTPPPGETVPTEISLERIRSVGF